MTMQRKSLLEQIEEAERKKAEQEKIESAANKIAQELEEMGVTDIDEKDAPEKIFKAVTACLRKEIYKEFPSADPRVVEALLLTSKNLYRGLATEIDKAEGNDVQVEALGDELARTMARFSFAMKKSIKEMN